MGGREKQTGRPLADHPFQTAAQSRSGPLLVGDGGSTISFTTSGRELMQCWQVLKIAFVFSFSALWEKHSMTTAMTSAVPSSTCERKETK